MVSKPLFQYLPGVNITNVLRAAFTLKDPKSAKKLLNLTVFFALLGSASVKAARKMMVKLIPELQRKSNREKKLRPPVWIRKTASGRVYTKLFFEDIY